MKTIRNASTTRHRALRRLLLPTLLLGALSAALLHAADSNPPERMTYQGFLVDANGTALATNAPKNYDVLFRIYDAQTLGNLKWSEAQTITVDKGYFSVLLGATSPRETFPTLPACCFC